MRIPYRTLAPADANIDALQFDLNVLNRFVYWDVRDLTDVTVQAVAQSTWGTAVLTLERSNDAVNWSALETAATIGVGGGMSAGVNCYAFAYLRARVSTAEGSQKFAAITAFGKSIE